MLTTSISKSCNKQRIFIVDYYGLRLKVQLFTFWLGMFLILCYWKPVYYDILKSRHLNIRLGIYIYVNIHSILHICISPV